MNGQAPRFGVVLKNRPRIVLITTGTSAVLDALLPPVRKLVGIVHSVAPAPASAAGRGRIERLARRVLERSGSGRVRLPDVAARHGLAFRRLERRRDPGLAGWMHEMRPDLIVVCGMLHLLEREVFSIPPLGTINVHPSLLPRHRGPDPVFWTYHGMDPESGVTVHFIDDGTDTGDIIFQEAFRVTPGMPRRELLQAGMVRLAPGLVGRAIEALADGRCPRTPQPRESPTPVARRVRGEEMRALLGWDTRPIEQVWHLLRGVGATGGLPPPPGWRRTLSWDVGTYSRVPGGGPAGTLGRDREGYYASHPEGRIRLAVRYSGEGLVRALTYRMRR